MHFVSSRALIGGMRTDHPLKAVFEKVGTATDLARLLGVTSSAVSQWRRIPIERAAQVERITGIPRQQLRPDIFGTSADVPRDAEAAE